MAVPPTSPSRAVTARLRGVHKSYGPVRVLDLPELDLYAGTVVGVVGENGAGKSTLMGTLSGSVHRDGGDIDIDGAALTAGSTEAAAKLGVAMVSQEFPLVGQLSVAENLLLGRRPRGSHRRILVDRAAQCREAAAMLAEVGLSAAAIGVDREVRSLPVPTRQMIEIAKAWGREPKLLIFDEPTSSLGPVEAEMVLGLARKLADRSGTVLFIGHRLDEVRAVSDRILVLRNGRLVADLTPAVPAPAVPAPAVPAPAVPAPAVPAPAVPAPAVPAPAVPAPAVPAPAVPAPAVPAPAVPAPAVPAPAVPAPAVPVPAVPVPAVPVPAVPVPAPALAKRAAVASEARLIREMVGGEINHGEPRLARSDTDLCLSVRHLSAAGLGPVDLDVRAGEIVGIAGLMGSGRSRLIHTIAGAQPATGGAMTLAGEPYAPAGPGDGAAVGIALIPEDRKEQSLIPFAPITANVTISILRRLSRNGILRPKRQRAEAQRITASVNVRMRSVDQPIGSLSGGNQQRAIFGRAFATRPRLLLLDEPTRGVDVGAKAEIYDLIDRAASDGTAVLVASSELEELQLICHRIAVMNRGRIVRVLDHGEATKERIMTAAAGTGHISAVDLSAVDGAGVDVAGRAGLIEGAAS